MKYLELIPLKNSLENRVTVYRVLRHMQVNITLEQYDKVCVLSSHNYVLKYGTKKYVNQRKKGSKYKKKVLLYPAAAIKEIQSIILKTIKPKRKRIGQI